LWAAKGELKEYRTKTLLSRLFGLSLLVDLVLGQGFFRLHDTTCQFLQDRTGKDGLVALHKQLVAALSGAASADSDARTRRYYYLFLPRHLAEAGEREKLDALLLDPAWLKAKLDASGNPQTLVADYEQHGVGELPAFLGRTLRLTTGILARDKRQLIAQLLGRVMGCKAAGTTKFLEAARGQLSPPAILALRGTLTPPGAETARLEGHSRGVLALCLLPEGRLASGSADNTIRLWDVAGGVETGRLQGHSTEVTALCVLPDGRLASGSFDETIRLWDAAAGIETARLGHSGGVMALCLLLDGRLASGSWDKTIRLWDATAGVETAHLEGHSSAITALCVLPDGRLASGSFDETIRLWDPAAGIETARLEGHSGRVTALCPLRDGRLASGSFDNTIRLWDATAGVEKARPSGHSGEVAALCPLPDGA
jgi:WD40 repeat protein